MNTAPSKSSIPHFISTYVGTIGNYKIWSWKTWAIAFCIVILGVFADQITKIWSVHYFFSNDSQIESVIHGSSNFTESMRNQMEEKKQNIIGEYITLEFALNKWIALSIPLHWLTRDIVTVIGITVVGILFILSLTKNRISIEQTWYLFILSGAISNGYDRIVYWQVIDFINIRWFAICNIADFIISIWVILLLYHTITTHKIEHEPNTRTSLT